MQRWRIRLEYDGTAYAGWQRQARVPTIQSLVEKAIFAFSQEQVTLFGAGRTDAGVHALGQVAHFDLAKPFEPPRLCGALNAWLRPHPIAVLEATPVSGSFHARFEARSRFYCYRILNRPSASPLWRHRSWHVRVPLDLASMQAAARVLCGRHDFSSFRGKFCQARSPIRTLDVFELQRNGDFIEAWLVARSFLQHQVRNLMGTVCLIGRGRGSVEDIPAILEARSRSAAGPMAPACGLYLVGVGYSDCMPAFIPDAALDSARSLLDSPHARVFEFYSS